MRRTLRVLAVVVFAFAFVGPARAAGTANVAALQVALHAKGLYRSAIDGILGPKTKAAVRRLQRRAGLRADGVVGPQTRAALGRLGRPNLGSRVMHLRHRGWDVAAVQFELIRHGFPAGTPDGIFGKRTARAVRAYQHSARLVPDGVVGPATLRALRRSPTTPVATGEPLGVQAAAIAKRLLGIPYVWSGDNPTEGFDCSGLTMYVYAQLQVALPHSSSMQFNLGTPVPKSQLSLGDLVFFGENWVGDAPRGRSPGHVGIFIGSGDFIEAPDRGHVVRVAGLDARSRALGYVGAVRPY
jgi:cell wall-associated NlpC family hydrolase